MLLEQAGKVQAGTSTVLHLSDGDRLPGGVVVGVFAGGRPLGCVDLFEFGNLAVGDFGEADLAIGNPPKVLLGTVTAGMA